MKAPILTNSKIAYKLAWEFSSKNNLIEPEELISEALLGYADLQGCKKPTNRLR
jgi:hypothetical protein